MRRKGRASRRETEASAVEDRQTRMKKEMEMPRISRLIEKKEEAGGVRD